MRCDRFVVGMPKIARDRRLLGDYLAGSTGQYRVVAVVSCSIGLIYYIVILRYQSSLSTSILPM
eukprot:1320026-Amorphochlora_amoeboformis.AAC.1